MDHYAEAERLLKTTRRYYNGGQTVRDEPPGQAEIERAKAHATLALVAELRRNREGGAPDAR